MMRRWLIAILLLLGGPATAAAQCGYKDVDVTNAHACGIQESDDKLACWGSYATWKDTEPTDAVLAVAISNSVEMAYIKLSDGSLVGREGQTANRYERCRDIVNKCNGGTDDGEWCVSASECAAPGTCNKEAPTLRCEDGPDRFSACTTNADCRKEYIDTPPANGPYTDIAGTNYMRDYCAINSTGEIDCYGVTAGYMYLDECAEGSPPEKEYDPCTTNSDCTQDTTTSTCFNGEDIPAGPFVQIDADDDRYCGVRTNGTVACWGWNNYGSATDAAGIYSEPAGTNFVKVAVGDDMACGLKTDQSIQCWGNMARIGVLGGDVARIQPPAGELWLDVAITFDAPCGITTEGRALCWGDATGAIDPPPTECTLTNVVAQYGAMCFLDTAQNLYCTSDSTVVAGTPAASCPIDADPCTKCYDDIAVGPFASCARDTYGEIDCWGTNYVCTGDGSNDGTACTANVDCTGGGLCNKPMTYDGVLYGSPNEPFPFYALKAGSDGAFCAMESAYQYANCWGNDDYNITSDNISDVGGLGLAVGSRAACTIESDSLVICWGDDTLDGGWVAPDANTFTADSIDGYDRMFCGVLGTGALNCWGVESDSLFTEPAGTDFVQVEVEAQHACAVRNDNTAICWGNATDAQSTHAAGSFDMTSVGDNTGCAISTVDELTCWGTDAEGVIAGTPAGTFSFVNGGTSTYCATTLDNNVECWGNNDYGIVLDAPTETCVAAAPAAASYVVLSVGM